MSGRASVSLVLSIWLIIVSSFGLAQAERWSRQVSNSDWIPLANPRNLQAQPTVQHSQNLPPLPQIHQPLIPGSLPPELRQEYQQQLLQLQKTQESIQRLLLLQEELKAQQQILQGQGFLPNGIAEGEENKQNHQQGSLSNSQLPEQPGDVLVPPPQLSNEARPPVYSSQNFRDPQSESIGQERYEDYNDRQVEDYGNAEQTRESLRDREKYVPEAPSGSANNGEDGNNGDEEVQVVYVPAETLAQHGQLKNQRGRDRKQFGNQETRPHHQQHRQRPFVNQRGQEPSGRDRENVGTTVSPQEDAYAREFLQQLQREHEGTDRVLKEARQKELERLREERREIQRQAKLQQEAVEREQEIQRQREAEKSRKELEKLEETAKQRELERLRDAREKQRQEELERAKKAQARANEKKRKQEEARQAEIERLASQERQKKAELERASKAQKEEEERAQEAERTVAGQSESTRHRVSESDSSPEAQPLIRNQHSHQQHQSHAGKYNRQNRNRNKPRQRQHNLQNGENFEQNSNEPTTTALPSPNQPPLAVYMVNAAGDSRTLRVSDVLKTLKDAKTIDVLDNVGEDAPQVFVGPSNLEVPVDYAKFDLPYLSSIDNNRVERRVDKLPFFVAPLSFNPPPGYAKIPFPAPHIGSVVVNTLDPLIAPTQPDDSYQDVRNPNLNPLIEPNSFIQNSDQGVSYSTTYDSPTTASYTNYRQEEPSSTAQYQSTPSYSTVEASGPGRGYRFRQQFTGEQPSAGAPEQPRPAYHEPQLRPTFQEESPLTQSNHAPQYSDGSSGPTTPVYRRPNVVTSFAYQESPQPVSSTPVYQESYSQVREDSTVRHPNAHLESGNHDLPEHREVIHRYQQENDRGQEYSNGPVDSGVNSYEETLRGPTQYNLPAELPPITPQLPGLVNSLLDEREQAAFVNRQEQIATTPTTTTTTTTTTTEAPTTTQRSRGRQRGRVTRPTTTTLHPPTRSVTRRPVTRSRSRFTTTTEEYRESYEPTKSKVAETTERQNAPESHRRPASLKNQKFKSREPETSVQASRNQVHNVQAHEADNGDRVPTADPDSRFIPNDQAYQQYNSASSTQGLENYPVISDDVRRPVNSGVDVDYNKNLNYPQAQPLQVGGSRNQEEQIGLQYQEQYTNSELEQPSLENAPINGFNYQTRNPQDKPTPTIPPTSRDYAFYQNKPDNFRGSQDSVGPTDAPSNSQINNYQRPGAYEKTQDSGRIQNEDLSRAQYSVNDGKTLNFEAVDSGIYDPYSQDNQDTFKNSGLAAQQAPLQVTTEAPTTTTTTTTEPPPVVIRQRVRGRLGVRGRPDSNIQTRPRGSQEEYVRFSAVNNQNTPTTQRPTTRHRENVRQRPKPRHQYQGSVQVQTEGNDYVRIQAPIRTYQKTIVTPPSTTRRTTTTPAPTTTTVQYEEEANDGLEYGFIRPPNFGPAIPVENKHQNSYRLGDNQAQLQSIAPTDETAEDSNLSHTQITRNKPKYQSPNRRPSNKPATTTTLASDISPYTERSRTRVEEPKNNRIRVKGRKPGRRRTTTTTTTTTEYILEDTNDLPLEENYPRPIQGHRQGLYEEKFEALPLASGASRNPIRQQSGDDTYSSQDFLLNFGNGPASPEPDQTQLASQPPRKYGNFGTRSRTHSTHRGGQDRDIHGAESQWSTKLTSSSFQPSPSANQLPQDDQKTSSVIDSEKNKYTNDQASPDAPEIITAAPEDSYVTVLVTSDDKEAKSMSAEAMEAPEMEGFNFGMKTSVESRSNPENTTPTFTSQDTFATQSSTANGASTESVLNGQTENFTDQSTNSLPTRRMGGRRRRVRVRVRPAPTEDFVTAESQHFNSALNNLVQDRLKFNRFEVESKEVPITTQPPILPQEFTTSEAPEKTIFEDFLDEMFKGENKSSIEASTSQAEDITTTMKPEEVYGQENLETSTINLNTETTTEVVENNSDDGNINESSTNAPVTESTIIPGKSWDSTKQYIDSIAMHSGEYLSNSKYLDNTGFDENLTGQGNEVFHTDFKQKMAEISGGEDESENYPKNHRSEWSEVRYPSDRGLFNYQRKLNLTAAQLPGVVTKAEGDTNVKTLSDYVKAIFDTMKNADEQKNEEDNFSTTVTSNEDQDVATSTDHVSEKDSTTIQSVPDFGGVFSDGDEISGNPEQTLDAEAVTPEKTTPAEETTNLKKTDELSEKIDNPKGVEMFGDLSGPENGESTEQPTVPETVGTAKNVESTEIPTSSSTSESLESFSTKPIDNADVSKSDDIPTTTTPEKSPMAIASSKLTGVVRTSTTTKVSHMTEICFRGRCVMTKPKKEFEAR